MTVAEKVIDNLTTMYSDEKTFNEKKIAVIVDKVVKEVITARNYKAVGYSDEQIESDLLNYESQIYNLSEYDFAHFGAPHETSHSELSSSRSWIDRSKLFSGIVALSPLR